MTFANLGRPTPVVWAGLLVGLAASGCQYQMSVGMPLASNMGPNRGAVAAARADVETVSYHPSGHLMPNQAVARQPEQGPDPRVLQPRGNGAAAQPEAAAQPAAAPGGPDPPYSGRTPTELEMTFMPCYIIEPPDELIIEAVRIVPKGPYRIEPLDVLQITVADALPNQPIAGQYQISSDGVVNLGFSYGSVRVTGMTLEQAANEIKKHLQARAIANPQVAIALAAFRGVQQVRGVHLVGMDGTIQLGSYGCVNVVGLSLKQAKAAIERHLSQFLLAPEISLQVSGFNSKYYYVIVDGGGYGQQVYRVASVGKETVLDAIAAIGGLPPVSSPRRIRVARPTPCHAAGYQILPVDWEVIVQAGATCTNYQLFPGDRVYIEADPLIRLDNRLAKIFAPIERVLGITLLGSSVYQSLRNTNGGTGGGAAVITGF